MTQHFHQIALFVISVAGSFIPHFGCDIFIIATLGFGRRVTWTSDTVVPPGHRMTFKDALHILSTNVILKIVVPNWAKNLTKQTRKVNLAFTEMKVCYLKFS